MTKKERERGKRADREKGRGGSKNWMERDGKKKVSERERERENDQRVKEKE